MPPAVLSASATMASSPTVRPSASLRPQSARARSLSCRRQCTTASRRRASAATRARRPRRPWRWRPRSRQPHPGDFPCDRTRGPPAAGCPATTSARRAATPRPPRARRRGLPRHGVAGEVLEAPADLAAEQVVERRHVRQDAEQVRGVRDPLGQQAAEERAVGVAQRELGGFAGGELQAFGLELTLLTVPTGASPWISTRFASAPTGTTSLCGPMTSVPPAAPMVAEPDA